MFDLLIGTATKLRLSGYMLRNINTFEIESWHFSENLKIVALKLLELTPLTSPKISIYFNFVWRCGSVVMSTFLNYPPVRSTLIVKVYMYCTLLKYFLFNCKNKIIFCVEDSLLVS